MESSSENTSRAHCTNEAFSEQVVTLKFCRFLPNKRYFHDSCGFLDCLGNVSVCKFHLNPAGRFTPRKSKVVRGKWVFFKVLLVSVVAIVLLFMGWLMSWLASLFDVVGYPLGFLFLLVVGHVKVPRKHEHLRHDSLTAGNCGCWECRSRLKLWTPEESRKLIEESSLKRIEKRYPLQDIPLFCRVFPEGLVGSCGFCWNGYCAVFEDGCVRWNELGDKKDYSVGSTNPFEGGEWMVSMCKTASEHDGTLVYCSHSRANKKCKNSKCSHYEWWLGER